MAAAARDTDRCVRRGRSHTSPAAEEWARSARELTTPWFCTCTYTPPESPQPAPERDNAESRIRGESELYRPSCLSFQPPAVPAAAAQGAELNHAGAIAPPGTVRPWNWHPAKSPRRSGSWSASIAHSRLLERDSERMNPLRGPFWGRQAYRRPTQPDLRPASPVSGRDALPRQRDPRIGQAEAAAPSLSTRALAPAIHCSHRARTGTPRPPEKAVPRPR
jgi:hypothetical protein